MLSVPRGADGAVTVVSDVSSRDVLDELNWITHRTLTPFCTPLNRDRSTWS